jgi:hypothetical protein
VCSENASWKSGLGVERRKINETEAKERVGSIEQ